MWSTTQDQALLSHTTTLCSIVSMNESEYRHACKISFHSNASPPQSCAERYRDTAQGPRAGTGSLGPSFRLHGTCCSKISHCFQFKQPRIKWVRVQLLPPSTPPPTTTPPTPFHNPKLRLIPSWCGGKGQKVISNIAGFQAPAPAQACSVWGQRWGVPDINSQTWC